MTDLAEQRERIEKKGMGIVIVHMASEVYASQILQVYELEDLPRVSDPEQVFYESFGLKRGNFWQVYGLRTWLRMTGVSLLNGHLLGKTKGDPYQLPGVFLLEDGKVRDSFKHRCASERPSYKAMAERRGEVIFGE